MGTLAIIVILGRALPRCWPAAPDQLAPVLEITHGDVGQHVHTNTHRERARLRRDATCMAFVPVLAVRSSKSARAAFNSDAPHD